MNATERRAAIQSSLTIAPRTKLTDAQIDALQEILHEALELGDEVFLTGLIQQLAGMLATLQAARAAAQK